MLLALLLNCNSVIPPRVIACRLGVGATAEPTYQDTVRYITLGRPLVLPADFLSCLPSHQRPSFSEFQDLTSIGRLHTTDDGKYRPLLVRQIISLPVWLAATGGHAARLLRDEPVRIYVPLLMRSWVIQGYCRSTAAPAAPRPHCKCSNGSLWTYASGGGFAIA